MKLKLTGLAVAAAFCIGGMWVLNRSRPQQTATTFEAGSVDCYRGVACPIIWSPPKTWR